MTEPVRAPWASEQVDALNRFQRAGRMHPFTCGSDHHETSPVLDATHSGWICPDPACEYTQDWAHAFMLQPGTAQPLSIDDAINEWNEYDDQRDREKDGEQPDVSPLPEPSDPTQRSGEPGLCPEHGHHAESLKQPDETAAPTLPTDPTAVLRDAETYLSALHNSVARHDQLGADFTCHGCRLREQITAVLAAVPSAPADQNLRDHIAQVLLTTPREGWTYTAGQEKWDHHKHGDRPGHNYAIYCALCTSDVDVLADAVLAELPAGADRAAEASLGEELDGAAATIAELTVKNGDQSAALDRVREWVTSDVVTAANEFGNGYREAQQAGEGR